MEGASGIFLGITDKSAENIIHETTGKVLEKFTPTCLVRESERSSSKYGRSRRAALEGHQRLHHGIAEETCFR